MDDGPPNRFQVDGQWVRVVTHVREDDGSHNSNRLPSYRVFVGRVYRGVYFRVDRGEPHHTEKVQVPRAWYCRPVRLDVERDAPTIGPFDGMLDAISALLRCHGHDRRR